MRSVYLISLAVLATASPLGIDPTIERRGSLPTPVSVATAKEYLSELKVAEPVVDPPYKRSGFKHWITIEGRCDTRESESSFVGTQPLKLLSIQNASPRQDFGLVSRRPISLASLRVLTYYPQTADYDGRSFTSATSLDIDHIVPLKEGWQAGAYNWTAKRREEFANDLIRPQLVAVSVSSLSCLK
ncbi:hypothetical protein AG1IA_01604 [Rhizoctonia solani AG-1 IA]|uniref:GmrSD restriction endonucleases C-terminal domain-containing protein n=1 Tax=Thanatephorus cucumeris (strain AG1-IA) TaxID=983506 RepID=L8X235_THACA|nr:hypothetical protein AG1IA_01604 [Rhizoctonia solani AG-1 IA]